jgi:isocitrate lyase
MRNELCRVFNLVILFSLLSKAADEGGPVHTMGSIDPVQMTQMALHQEVVYISCWAACIARRANY